MPPNVQILLEMRQSEFISFFVSHKQCDLHTNLSRYFTGVVTVSFLKYRGPFGSVQDYPQGYCLSLKDGLSVLLIVQRNTFRRLKILLKLDKLEFFKILPLILPIFFAECIQ